MKELKRMVDFNETLKNVLPEESEVLLSLAEDVIEKIGAKLITWGTFLGEKRTREQMLYRLLTHMTARDAAGQTYANSMAIGALVAILGIEFDRINREKEVVKAGPHKEEKGFLRTIRTSQQRFPGIPKADSEMNNCQQHLNTTPDFAGIIGQDFKMQELFSTIRDVADINVPVLIQGESGTGKELVAAAIHKQGPRSTKPFMPVNCGALPEGLLESELFGHVKGAFTGAVRDKKGRFELANGGTLFLDEVVDLPKFVQAKLLRVLQEGKFERVGDEKTISVDVRLISAANRDLKREVESGNFRDDLYYRLNVVPINIPPLKERKKDIPLLVEHFLKQASGAGREVALISKEALFSLMDYNWPGNVRELQSAIRYAHVKSKGQIIRPQHLPALLETQKSVPSFRGPSKKLDFKRLQDTLSMAGGNKSKTASLLGVGRATIYRHLAKHPATQKNPGASIVTV